MGEGGRGTPAAVSEGVGARVENAFFLCWTDGGVEEREEPFGAEGMRVGVPFGVARYRPAHYMSTLGEEGSSAEDIPVVRNERRTLRDPIPGDLVVLERLPRNCPYIQPSAGVPLDIPPSVTEEREESRTY